MFWAKVSLHGPVPAGEPGLGMCWVWTAGTRNGYGAFNVPATPTTRRHRVDAHRWAYETYVGPVPDGHDLIHLCHAADLDHCDGGPACRHRACVNYQNHLAVVPHRLAVRGITARHAAQTTCPHGHPYDRVTAAGHRRCSTCDRHHAERHRFPGRSPT